MAKSPLILAALAKDAVPQLDFTQALPLTQGHGDRFDSAILTAVDGRHFVIRQAKSAAAELVLDTELVVLRALAPYRAHFPFEITKLVGETRDARGKRALLFTYVYGENPDFGRIRATSPFVTSMANALNAIHSLPLSVVENNGLPTYDPSATVKELVADLDRAAQTGMVPAVLLNRWERALEDVSLWRFQPCVIHGEANSANFLEMDEAVSAVLGWEGLRIGDPAQDLAWIHGQGNPEFSYSTTLEYERMRGGVDENLRARAQLYAEMEYALYLMGALRSNDAELTRDAVHFLEQLVADIETGVASPIGPKPLGTDSFGTDSFVGDLNSFGNAPAVAPDLGSPAGFIDASQAVVVASPGFEPQFPAGFEASPVATTRVASGPSSSDEVNLPDFLVAIDDERDPAEVDLSKVNPFKPVVDDSYNHRNLFGATSELPVLTSPATEPIQTVSEDATAPIQLPKTESGFETAEDAKPGELF